MLLMNEQDARPRNVVALWKANLEEPKFNLADPSVVIVDSTTSNFLLTKFSSCATSCYTVLSYFYVLIECYIPG